MWYYNVILECDALKVVHVIPNKQDREALIFLLFDDIISISGTISSFRCVHIKRNGSVVAHMIVRRDTNIDSQHVCLDLWVFRSVPS